MKKKSFLTLIMAFAMASLCCLLTACSDDDNDDTPQQPITSGTFTAPTTTVAASSVTALANVRSGTIQVSHNPANDRYNFGASGKKGVDCCDHGEVGGDTAGIDCRGRAGDVEMLGK